MGLLDSLMKNLGNGKASGNQNAIGGILELLNSDKVGGIQGIISKLSSSGLGNIVESWIGTGANKAIGASQLQSALGSDIIGQFASKLGLSHEETLGQLTKLLPNVIDKLTPQGKVPEQAEMGNIQDILKKFL